MLEHKDLVNSIKRSAGEINELKSTTLKQIANLLGNPNSKKAKDRYDELFSLNNQGLTKKNANGTTVYNIFDHIVTTNYDLALERYARGHPFWSMFLTDRGFQKIPSEETKFLDLVYLRTNFKDIHYLKLHGSLDWWERDDKKIILSDSENPMYGGTLIEQLMIYPVYEKYISMEPFFSLYTAFRRILLEEKIIIVIGYSFRDISINNAFLNTLTNDRESRMIICAKSPAVKQRISDKFQGYMSRISLIDKYFGEKGFISDLKDRLENQNI